MSQSLCMYQKGVNAVLDSGIELEFSHSAELCVIARTVHTLFRWRCASHFWVGLSLSLSLVCVCVTGCRGKRTQSGHRIEPAVRVHRAVKELGAPEIVMSM